MLIYGLLDKKQLFGKKIVCFSFFIGFFRNFAGIGIPPNTNLKQTMVMKKFYLLLLCTSALLMTACGSGGKTDGSEGTDAEEECVEMTDEEATDEAAEEADRSQPAELSLTVEEELDANLAAVYEKCGVKPCLSVFFKDDLKNETLNEFPSKWELSNGDAEVKTWRGRKAIFMTNNDTEVSPQVSGESRNYLPEVFTLDFDYFCNGEGDEDEDYNACYHILMGQSWNDYMDEITLATETEVGWRMCKLNDEELYGNYTALSEIEKADDWNHFTLSFDKGLVKIFINGTRVANLPKMKQPYYISIKGEGWDDHRYYFTNVRLATE